MKSFVAAIFAVLALESQAVFLMDGDSTADENTSLNQLSASIEDGSCKTTEIELGDTEGGVSCAIDLDAESKTLTVVTTSGDCGCDAADEESEEEEEAEEEASASDDE